MIDAVEFSQRLIRCPSVTPEEGGALDLLQETLEGLGFRCHRLLFSEDGTPDVDNLYARFGDGAPNFCFAGHTDVVPPGDLSEWTVDPFVAEIRDGILFGRGAVDMKTAIAAFVGAAEGVIASGSLPGSISLLITGDEEGPAANGTRKVLQWLKAEGEILDACVVGEPTNPTRLGEMMKIGRRGSMNSIVSVYGQQGHVAYPHLADSAAHRLVKMMDALISAPLDDGNEHFQASSLQITSIDIGNSTENVIPGAAEGRFNIRFNDMHSSDTLKVWIKEQLDAAAGGADKYGISIRVSGESFIFPPGPLSNLVADCVERVTGERPEMSTTGGTSDARFIKDYCPVCEFGLVGKTMHKVDENCRVEDITALLGIYRAILEGYFRETK
jgi:succinyl-diaminopimelate desuccinylase